MVKILACLFMLIDHIGMLFFPEVIELRLIGRLAMPLFAFCIARGFYNSKNKNTYSNYIKRIIIFSIVSQIPYMLMVQEYKLNIGFLWLFSLLFLGAAEKEYKNTTDYLFLILIPIVVTFIPIDYGTYGFVFTLIFYYFRIRKDNGFKMYLSWTILHVLRLLLSFEYGIIQLFTLPCFSILNLLEKHDNKLKVNKIVFYSFYPVHISVLVAIKYIIGIS